MFEVGGFILRDNFCIFFSPKRRLLTQPLYKAYTIQYMSVRDYRVVDSRYLKGSPLKTLGEYHS